MSFETNYIRITEVRNKYASYFTNVRLYLTHEQLIKELKLTDNDYIWCTKKNNKLIKTDNLDANKKVSLFLSRDWLTKHIAFSQKKKHFDNDSDDETNLSGFVKDDSDDSDDIDDISNCELNGKITKKSNDNLSTEDVEIILDKKIKKYNGFSEHHPMEGVSYNKSSNTYNIISDNTNTSSKDKLKACKKILDHKNTFSTTKFMLNLNSEVKLFFIYQDAYFIIYKNDSNEYYFDILHIISTLNLGDGYATKKYNEFKSQIKFILPHKNQFGGYIFRELISEDTVYAIILSSNSKISKCFKFDVTKILSELRKSNNLVISNKEIKLKKKTINQNNEFDQQLLHAKIYTSYKYDDLEDQLDIQKMVLGGSMIPLSKYVESPVIYCVILPLLRDSKHVIIKFGYTDDIIKRIDSLKSEYKCNIYLIGLKFVRSEKTEKNFHTLLHKTYPQSVVDFDIDGKEKVELYQLSDTLLNEFSSIPEFVTQNNSHSVHSAEQLNVISYIKNQHKLFIQFIQSKISVTNVIFNNDDNLLKYHQMNFDYLNSKSIKLHDQIMKELENQKLRLLNGNDRLVENEKLRLDNEKLILTNENLRLMIQFKKI
jgi:hypothetical protein